MEKPDKNEVGTPLEVTTGKETKKKGIKGKAVLAAAVPIILHLLWHSVLHFSLVAVTAVTFKDSLALGIIACVVIAVIATIICAIRHKRGSKCSECGLTAEQHHKH
jgi:hypothetical protein